MGYIRHKALIVNGWDDKRVRAARTEVLALYAAAGNGPQDDFEGLVSPLILHVVNGGASFFVAPDGSKEGWETSATGDDLLEKAKAAIRAHEYVDYCEVLCGGDDDEFAVLDSTAASVDGRPKDGDALAAPLATSAVPEGQTPNSPPTHFQG